MISLSSQMSKKRCRQRCNFLKMYIHFRFLPIHRGKNFKISTSKTSKSESHVTFFFYEYSI